MFTRFVVASSLCLLTNTKLPVFIFNFVSNFYLREVELYNDYLSSILGG